jgi:hypothetical protein
MSQGNFTGMGGLPGMPGMPGMGGPGMQPVPAAIWAPSRRRKRKKISLKKVSDSCSRRKK